MDLVLDEVFDFLEVNMLLVPKIDKGKSAVLRAWFCLEPGLYLTITPLLGLLSQQYHVDEKVLYLWFQYECYGLRIFYKIIVSFSKVA